MVLASYIRPFDAKQKIYVLDGKKNTEEIVIADLDNYADAIMQIITQYQIDGIELHGNENICEKIKKDILATEFTKYNNNQLKIKIKGAEV